MLHISVIGFVSLDKFDLVLSGFTWFHCFGFVFIVLCACFCLCFVPFFLCLFLFGLVWQAMVGIGTKKLF